jgi:hypothetical protein
MRHHVVLVLLSIVLGSCAVPITHASMDASTKSGPYAWDGMGRDPNLPPPRRAAPVSGASNEADDDHKREQVLATLRPYSAAWWAVREEIESGQDARLDRKLVICRGC